MTQIAAVDLFCGAGGLTHGIAQSGIKVVAGFDIDENCRYAYERNNAGAVFYNCDVSDLKGEDIKALYPHGAVKLLAGCAPCQPFSTYSQGRDARKDKKWPLLYSFSRLVREVDPELVTMENVPDVTKHEVYHDFVNELKSLGYRVWANRVFCPEYGMPQIRKRHVLLASKLGVVSLAEAKCNSKDYATVKDAIGSLPPIGAGESYDQDPLHRAARLTEINLKRVRASKPGGTWRDWPEDLVAECHRKLSGRSYSGVYARMQWDKPSPTITTQCFGFGNGRFGHPEQNRAITLREAAILQTFPNDYEFVEPGCAIQFKVLGRMIGNAVPVKLGKLIGDSLVNHVAT
ncbi:MAG: DNA cytosine methyltransferase [Pontibacterium sp.]